MDKKKLELEKIRKIMLVQFWLSIIFLVLMPFYLIHLLGLHSQYQAFYEDINEILKIITAIDKYGF